MRLHQFAAAVAVVLCGSCGSKTPPADRPNPPVLIDAAPAADATPVALPTPPPVEVALPAGFPDTVAGHQLAWVIDVITQRKGAVDVAEVEQHFDPSFLAAVPADKTAAVFGQLATQAGSMTITAVKSGSDANGLRALATVAGTTLAITLSVDPAGGKIVGLLFAPADDDSARPKTYAEAEKLLPTLAEHASLLIATVDKNGGCKAVHAINSKDELAIGSTFKLYVLLALTDQILAGKLDWSTELEVRDEWKSLPSGVTQDDPAGTKLGVRELAERMISISDNTATDHLLYTVGRRKVEAALGAAKHAKPKLDTPFLGTRELFVLKLMMAHDDVDKFIQLGAEKRRAKLDGDIAAMKPTLEGVEAWKDARRIETLEWFASGEDLCRVMGAIRKRAKAAKAAPVLEVLSKNPGMPFDAQKFPYVGFKGGSEPGVLNLTWLLRRDDDKWFVVSLGFNSSADPLPDEMKVLGFAKGVIDVLAAEK